MELGRLGAVGVLAASRLAGHQEGRRGVRIASSTFSCLSIHPRSPAPALADERSEEIVRRVRVGTRIRLRSVRCPTAPFMLRAPSMRPSGHKAIGVFDSGVGGLTVLRALMERLPKESTVYLGDTARVPYGTKSAEVVTRYSVA